MSRLGRLERDTIVVEHDMHITHVLRVLLALGDH
jgi:hypothetical protein